MYRHVLLPLLLLLSFSAYAQHQLKGRVVDEQTQEPLEFVSVYLNTTTTGTRTDEQGEFQLSMGAGRYEVVVSYVGYDPIIFTVHTDSLAPAYLFKLSPKAYSLQEVEVTAERGEEWYHNLGVFKQNFLGNSELGRQCKILNPEVLIIVFDPQTNVLDVQAKDVLRIENPALGYTIEYLLTDFKLNFRENYSFFLGYPRFIPMQGGRGKQKRWERNRQIAYKGSFLHFVRAVQQQQLVEQGFNLRRLYRLPNPERPSEEAIAAARAELRERAKGGAIRLEGPSAEVLRKARLPKFVEQLDTTAVPYTAYLHKKDGVATLAFDHFMQVVYTGEKEEPAYVQQFGSGRSPKPSYQTSVFSLKTDRVQLEKNGSVSEPLDVLLEGYWGWEKVGEMLPLNYGL
ncbi:MAG: carboxypeptidase-like regulatory domain-containing protein [Hymenobacteraceae bacterium]|nr:carboxypeptidase-like regulatory domain-containing protein [Hymenobacteraceae bacterium]